jgi:predicted dehydrogenase
VTKEGGFNIMTTEKKSTELSRRELIKRAAATSLIAGFPTIIPGSALGLNGRVAPSNRVTMGFIGTGNQGTNDMRVFLGDERVQVVAVCDLNKESAGYWDGGVAGREPAKRLVEENYAADTKAGTYKGCTGYADFRELIARKDIDAVEVATPDHWHALAAIAAMKSGKDVYCQKPLALTIVEGRAIADAVKKYKRIFQTGSQQRSDPHFRRAAELVRNGRVGKLKEVRVGLPGGRTDYGHTANRKKPEPVPEGFDYEMWLGPAPKAEYAPARCHVNFRWIYDYSGGQVTDWGGHHPDCAQWGMGTELTGPVEIRNAKGVFPPDELWNTATEFYFEAIYKDGVKMIVTNNTRGGVTWEGTDGWVFANRGIHEASSPAIMDSEIGENEIHLYKSNSHYRNFIDGVLTRKECIAPAEVAHRSITICHLGNIAMRLGKETLKWDPDKEKIIGDDEASKMLKRAHRAPWKLG